MLVDVSGVRLRGNVVELGRQFKCLIGTHSEWVLTFLGKTSKKLVGF